MSRLGFADTWGATIDAVRSDASTYATIAAAFVLLPTMAVAVLGPGDPQTLADLNGSRLVVQLALTLIGAVAQLAIAALACRAVASPREALRRAVARLPALVAAGLLTAFALVPAVLLLQASRSGYPALILPGLMALIPGLYAAARLSLALPLLSDRTTGPIAALSASWAITAGHGWLVLGFLAAVIAVLIVALLLAGGVAAAVGSVLTLIGAKPLGDFLVALISALIASGYTLVNSVALATIYRRLGG